MKKVLLSLILLVLFPFLFINSFSKDEDKKMVQPNMNQQQAEKEPEVNADMASGNTEFEMEDMLTFASPPSKYNQNAEANLKSLNTKNTTRINSNDPIETAVITSQTIFPATHNENQPGAVILVPLENWQIGLASGSLVHHAYNGPILFYTESGIPNSTLDEIRRLNPLGNRFGTQVMLMGTMNNKIESDLKGYQVETLSGNNLADFATKVDENYSIASGKGYSKGVIIVSSDERAKLYSLPAINWTAHREEPVLFVSEEEIPEETIKSLQKRKNANIYVLGPKHIISNQVLEELSSYGKVTRIAGTDPTTTSIKFAQYKDVNNAFGWGLKEPGHGLSFVSSEYPELAIAAAPFSHLGKHAPLIWLDKGNVTNDLYIFLASIKPSFKDDPSKGPYNHGYLIGDEKSVSFSIQGILDEKLEIAPISGEGHGGH